MNDLDWDLLDRYLAGIATPAERQQFERWLAGEADRSAVLDALRNALAAAERDVTPEELEAVWQRIANRTGVRVGQTASMPTAKPAIPGRFDAVELRQRRWLSGAGLAAAAILVAGGAFAAWQMSSAGRVTTEASRVVSVPRGQQAQLRLPDGTEVLLSAGSTLRHPHTFADRSREVTLEGEAYFRVKHEEQRPFRVRAGDLVATDLGTEFLVRAYPESKQARVVVRSGSVAVRSAAGEDKGGEGIVRPGELGRLGDNGEPMVEQADTAAYFAWTTGTLVFDGAPLSEALPQLSRWYDLDFRLADSTLGAIPLSGRLDRTLTPSRLELLASSLGLEQVRRGREVLFYRRDAMSK